MGLDTSHDCWHGAYSAFGRWRNELAKAAGYWVIPFPDGYDSPVIDWGHITQANLYGEWESVPADPLIILIAHYDCEGVIKRPHCAPLANRLEELLPLLPEGSGGGHIRDWREKTKQFISGLRLAHELGEDVDFH